MKYDTVMAYALGGCALTFMGLTLHYQALAHESFDEVVCLKEKICRMEAVKRPAAHIAPATLSVQNRNPLNVKAISGSDKWQGQIGRDKHGHAVFATWEHGMRAGAIVLKNYKLRHGIETVRGIVERFAEGNRAEYINFLCRRLRVKPDEKIDIIRRMPEILRAMARFESGESLPDHLFVAYDILGRL